MPGGDRTGPMGMGPMTGRGLGYCAGYNQPGYMSPAPGMGMGRGFGGGRGRGFGRGMAWGRQARWGAVPAAYGSPEAVPWPAYGAAQDEKQALEGEARALQQQLDAIRKRLDELTEESAGQE